MTDVPATDVFADERDAAHAAAARAWRRLNDLPGPERLAAATEVVWGHGYPLSYKATFAATTGQIAAAATAAAAQLTGLDDPSGQARASLRRLADLAEKTEGRRTANGVVIPPAHRATVAAVHRAARTPGDVLPWTSVTNVAWPAALRNGAANGTLEAATETFIAWRKAGLAGASINGEPITERVHSLIAGVTREVAPPWITAGQGQTGQGGPAPAGPAVAGKTAGASAAFPRLSPGAVAATSNTTTSALAPVARHGQAPRR